MGFENEKPWIKNKGFGAPAPHPPWSPTGGRHSGQLLCRQGYGRAIRGPQRQKCCCGAAGNESAGTDPDPPRTAQVLVKWGGAGPRTTADPAPGSTPSAPVVETPLTPTASATQGGRLTASEDSRFPACEAYTTGCPPYRWSGPKTCIGKPPRLTRRAAPSTPRLPTPGLWA